MPQTNLNATAGLFGVAKGSQLLGHLGVVWFTVACPGADAVISDRSSLVIMETRPRDANQLVEAEAIRMAEQTLSERTSRSPLTRARSLLSACTLR